MENAAYIFVMFIVVKGVHFIAREGTAVIYVKLSLKGEHFLVKRKRERRKNETRRI
jgi:hypothetical protein